MPRRAASERMSPAHSLHKLQLLHEIMPRLWCGGWAALNNDCQELRSRGVTHVVSVVSADQRRLPPFVKGHYYARVDDRAEAAKEIATHFAPIADFIEAARSAGGTVFVHCGAGISRAPTVTTAYMMRKLGLPRPTRSRWCGRRGRACGPTSASPSSCVRGSRAVYLLSPRYVQVRQPS